VRKKSIINVRTKNKKEVEKKIDHVTIKVGYTYNYIFYKDESVADVRISWTSDGVTKDNAVIVRSKQ